MQATTAETVRDLDRRDIDAVLTRGIIGRIAYMRNGEIDVCPVNYVYQDGMIYGRRSGGPAEFWECDGEPVAFEVDEIRSGRNWSSILVHGTLDRLSPDDDRDGWARGIGAIRRLQRDAGKGSPDPANLFRIRVASTTGRVLS